MGWENAAVEQSRGMAAKQAFLVYYYILRALQSGLKISLRYRESGRLSGVVIKRGSTVVGTNTDSTVFIHKPYTKKKVVKCLSHFPPVPSLNIKNPEICQWLALSVLSPRNQ